MTAPKSAPRRDKPTYIAGATAAENRASSKKSAAKANPRKSNTGSVSASLPKKSNVIRNVSSGGGGTSKAPGYIAPMQATTAPAGGTSSSPGASDPFSSAFEAIRNQPSGGGMNGFTGFKGMDDVKKLFGL